MTPTTTIQRVLVISHGIAVFNYTSQNEGIQISDEQLLSGFLGAFQSFSNDLGTEINAVKFKSAQIFYRIIRIENSKTESVSIVFIADETADEKDIRIRMEYACQIFVNKYMKFLASNILDEKLFRSFKDEIQIIVTADRNNIENLLPKTFLQTLLKELQASVPLKQLEKLLKKYDFVFDQKTKTLITPGDISHEKEQDIIKQLEQATKMLFGKNIWDNAYANASRAVVNSNAEHSTSTT